MQSPKGFRLAPNFKFLSCLAKKIACKVDSLDQKSGARSEPVGLANLVLVEGTAEAKSNRVNHKKRSNVCVNYQD
jgi:hypothetical protein